MMIRKRSVREIKNVERNAPIDNINGRKLCLAWKPFTVPGFAVDQILILLSFMKNAKC